MRLPHFDPEIGAVLSIYALGCVASIAFFGFIVFIIAAAVKWAIN